MGRAYDMPGDKQLDTTKVGMNKAPGFDSHRVITTNHKKVNMERKLPSLTKT